MEGLNSLIPIFLRWGSTSVADTTRKVTEDYKGNLLITSLYSNCASVIPALNILQVIYDFHDRGSDCSFPTDL